jgi:hypothetical protein
MQLARSTVDAPIDYINTHGTSTPVGDTQELLAIREVFGEDIPRFASSKSLCGHSLGATGVQEAIHCLLMLENDFIAPSINVVDPDAGVDGMPLVTSRIDNARAARPSAGLTFPPPSQVTMSTEGANSAIGGIRPVSRPAYPTRREVRTGTDTLRATWP